MDVSFGLKVGQICPKWDKLNGPDHILLHSGSRTWWFPAHHRDIFFSNRSNKLSSWYFFLIGQINFKSAWLTLIDWYNHTICKRIVRVTILLHVSSIASPACHEFDALGNISLYKRIEDVIVVRNEYWLEWYLTSRIKAPVVCHAPPWTLRHADIRSRDTTFKNSMI